jgi:predicted kinase
MRAMTAPSELPLSPATREALDRLAPGRPEIALPDLWQALAQQPGNLGSALLAALPSYERQAPDSSLPIAVLREHAWQEALRSGSPRVGCEHMVIGALRHAESAGAVPQGTAAQARSAFAEAIADRTGRALLALEPLPGARVPLAVVITGLPGSGKSTLAEAVAARTDTDLFALDWQLGALAPFGLVRQDNGRALAEHLQNTALAHHLVRRRNLVMDTIGARVKTRARWFELAETLNGRLIAVECVCPDEQAHHERVARRSRGIPGWPATVDWEHVQRTREHWEPWEQDRLVIDTLQPLDDCVERVVRRASEYAHSSSTAE